MPASYLIMFEVSSACKSLHRGLAIIRHASADSTYSSRLNHSHLVNYMGNALLLPLWVFLWFYHKVSHKKENTLEKGVVIRTSLHQNQSLREAGSAGSAAADRSVLRV